MILDTSLRNWLIFFAFIIGGAVVGKIVHFIFKHAVLRVTASTKTKLDDVIVESLERPFVFLIVLGGFYFGFQHLALEATGHAIAMRALKLLLFIDAFWFATGFVDELFEKILYPHGRKTDSSLDDNIYPILQKALKWAIWVIAIVTIINNFGYDVGSMIAGLGIGGLAFALAAKDLLGNMFGGISLLLDAPFRIGDTVMFDGVEGGSVKSIGLRSSRVETWDGPIVTVPNSVLANNIITSRTGWKRSRVKLVLGLTYDTSPKQIEKAIDILRKILSKEESVDQKLTKIHFVSFGAHSLNIQALYFITDLDNRFDVQDRVNLEIKKQFDKASLDFAFPTQTIEYRKVR